MKKIVFAICTFFAVSMAYAQSNSLEQVEEDSTIAVIAYFSVGDTLEYEYVHQKQRIKDNDTTTTVDVTMRFKVVVTDSTSKSYKMVLLPLEKEKGETIYDKESLQFTDLITMPIDVPCRFTTDEMGSIQHIDNWMEIRDSLKVSYKKVLDEVYSQTSQLDSIIPRQRMESALLLKSSTESGILEIYQPLKILFNIHGLEFSMAKKQVDSINEYGYPTHIDIEAFLTEPTEDTDREGDYAVIAETTAEIKSKDLASFIEGTVGLVLSDSIAGKVAETMESEEFANMNLKVVNHELYTYFYNGWPKMMAAEKVVGVEDKAMMIESHIVEWTSRRWTEYESTDDDGDKKDM